MFGEWFSVPYHIIFRNTVIATSLQIAKFIFNQYHLLAQKWKQLFPSCWQIAEQFPGRGEYQDDFQSDG